MGLIIKKIKGDVESDPDYNEFTLVGFNELVDDRFPPAVLCSMQNKPRPPKQIIMAKRFLEGCVLPSTVCIPA